MRGGMPKIFTFVGLLWIVSVKGGKLKNFCYFTNWSNKLASFDARFEIRDINTTLCTHLIYAFANIDQNKMKLIPSQPDDDNGQLYNKQGRYFDFAKLKNRAPHLVTLLSVGGASAGAGEFLQVVRSKETMMLFSRNCATFLRDRDFDGIHIDWEYPDVMDRDKYTQLLEVMREEFNTESAKVSKPTLLISIAVDTIVNSYNVTAISRVVDFIQVMTYDFHGPWSDVTSFSGPLFSRSSNVKFNPHLSQAWAIDNWLSNGAPAHKIVMGMTGAAVTFTLPNRTNTGVGAPVLSPGRTGPYLQRPGHVTYFRVCEMIRHGAVYNWDDEQKMAYAVMVDQWVGYGNEKSMTEKVKFAYNRRIAGTMFWSLDLDDFQGIYCNKGEFPLLNAIYKATQEFAPKEPYTGMITARPVTRTSSTPQSTTPPSTTQPAVSAKSGKLKNFCYFTNWSNKLATFEARFQIRDINTTLCTHLIYAYANIDPNSMKLIPSQPDDDNGQLYNKQGRYFDFAKLKVRAPHLVTFLSVGGASAGTGGFLPVVQSQDTMRLFSRNCATYLRDRDFDGIDIDWEYPDDIYRDKYTQFLEVMRDEFNKEAMKVSKPTLLISIATGVGKDTTDKSYNITAISRVVDFIHLMTYDFHGPWSDVTSFSGPLFSRSSSLKFDQSLSQAWAIDYWISKGAPAHKLVMGMTGAAVTFTLPNRTNTGVGAPVVSPGRAGPYLQSQGHVTYFRVCEMIRHGAVYKWDDEQKMAYAVMEDQWAGYSNEKSMKEKVKFAYNRRIAGTMFWSLDLDDFQGIYCNKGEFPLLNAIYQATQVFAPNEPYTGTISARPVTRTSSTPQSTTPPSTTQPVVSAKSGKLKNFCYFTNWSNKLASFEARYQIRDINTTLCTHLIYAFANIDPNKMKLTPSQPDDDNGQLYNKQGRYFDFTKLKIRAPHLVTLLSVGGASAGTGGFLPVVQSQDTMRLFSRNCAIYLRDRDFDGIDIDWEYPDDIYKDKYTQLLEVMREEFNKEAANVSKPTLLITIAVGVGKDIIDRSYNVPAISRAVDYIHVMTYDFFGPWSYVTGFSGPLFPRASDVRFDPRLNQAWAIDYWITKGAPAHKLVMGMTGAAVTFTLPNRTNTGVGAPVVSPGMAGPYLQRQGHVTYFRVCDMIRHGAVYKWDYEQKMAYAALENQWVGYGNEKSMTEKVKFAYTKRLAGTMFWSLDLDDFHGAYCNKGEFPLLNAIYKATQDFAPKEQHTGVITARPTTPPSTRDSSPTSRIATSPPTTRTTSPPPKRATSPPSSTSNDHRKPVIKLLYSIWTSVSQITLTQSVP